MALNKNSFCSSFTAVQEITVPSFAPDSECTGSQYEDAARPAFSPAYAQHSASIASNPHKTVKAWRSVHLSQFSAMLPRAGAQNLWFRKSLHTCAS